MEIILGGAAVHCDSREVARQVLELNGYTLGGRIVKASVMDRRWSAQEVIDFVSQRLELEAKVIEYV